MFVPWGHFDFLFYLFAEWISKLFVTVFEMEYEKNVH